MTINEYLIEGLFFPRIVNPRTKKNRIVDRAANSDTFITQRKQAFRRWADQPGYKDYAKELSIDEMLNLAAQVPMIFQAKELLIFRNVNDALLLKIRVRSVRLSEAYIHVRPTLPGVEIVPMTYPYRRKDQLAA